MVGIVGIVGSGAMGRGIAQIAAQAGCQVLLNDARPEAAAEARAALIAQWQKLVIKGRLTAAAAEAAGQRLQIADGLDALAAADVVVEAIVEDLAAKQALFRQLDDIVRADCILASNTSSLSITAIAAGTARPGRVAGFHFFNPVPLMKVVEVVAGALSEAAVLDCLSGLARAWGHHPVRAADTPGFIVNHAGRAYVTEALAILREGVASVPTIDAVLRAAGFRLGPFELLDLNGLDVSHPVMESIYRQFYDDPRYRPSPLAAQRLAGGLLGRKSGRGFYRYDAEAADVQMQDAGADAGVPPWDGPVWVDPANPAAADAVRALLAALGATLDAGDAPGAGSLIVLAPEGGDVSGTVAARGFAARRSIGIDTLLPLSGGRTLMTSPATDPELAARAQGLFSADGVPAMLIADSAGFIAQRVLAMVVNIGCEIVQQGICSAADLDRAVELGLAYPQGPLAWGDALGPARLLAILRALQARTGDMRYRPSLYLVRRAELGLPLTAG